MNSEESQIPVYDLDSVVAMSQQHMQHIGQIQEEIGVEWDNINHPEPFIVSAF